ncbi:MobF family relaxase [Granulicella mallensis]|uniref:Conjugative relaxase-like TrwC/TraI family protein n=1 Tax=Granulicella mallensis TaxID=940614 RepID=A0A7W8E8C9_9BACT|nr:MobF family relaxase [Granulicella mallensis]MBB5062506.1 conjugative relaxase-like TrwC/TraI family protein [Granulicella mallensis]
MLTISKPLSSGQAQTYHAKEFTSAEQNYWKQGDSILGEWQGRMAEQYGLAGGIDAVHFARLSDGQNPLTGEQLVRHRNGQEYTTTDGATVKPVEHRAGWDATFSAPKSVSLTALVGGDDRVRYAHREAVTTALTELERYTQARIGGNRAAETTGKFIAAKFEHDTARPVDGYAAPQLHTHAVIFNMTERADGSTRAVQPQSYFDSQQFATAVYQSELMYRLYQLGYEITPGRSGAPEIKGYTQEYLDASSPRSQQIREYLEKSGFAGPEAAQIAAHSTRDKKEIHTPSEVLAAHRQVAAAFGNQADQVVRDARHRANGIEQMPLATMPKRVQEAVTFSKSRNFEREAVTDERDLMRDALRRGMGDLTYRQVRERFEERVTSGEFQSVPGQKHETGRQFTTREAIAEELATIKHMQQGQLKSEPIMGREDAASHARERELLNPAQRKAIEEILTSQDRIHGLQGLAGSGKTSALSGIREGAEQNGYAVEGLAPTSRAAGQLRDAGIPADTLQGFLSRGGTERSSGDPTARHLYMLDESSLASTRQMQAFLQKIGPQDRVLLIGDTRQHQGVDAGKPFEQMQEAGMRTSHLDQIVRQKDPELLRAVEHLSRNETNVGVQLLQEQGRVTEIPDRQQRIDAIAKEYVARPEGTLIVSPDNAGRRDINDAVRAELQRTGVLPAENHQMTVLIQRSELTSADRNWAALYQPEDVLFYTRGSKELGLDRGSYATVLSTDPRENRLTVERQDGQNVSYNPERLHGIAAYREISREFAEGDRLQFTVSKPEMDVKNRDLGTIERIDGISMTVRMDGEKGRSVTFDSSQMRHFDHGYAVTSHSSQGLTTDRVLINMDTTAHPELINTRFAYVSVSRAVSDARLYTNDATTLAQRLNTDISKTSAMQLNKPNSQTQERSNTSIQPKENTMTNTREQSPEEQRRQSEDELTPVAVTLQTITESDQRHYAPLLVALPNENAGYEWRRETGDIQSYQHNESASWLHIDPQGQFYDRHAQPITREHALEHAGHVALAVNEISQAQSLSKGFGGNDQGLSL